MQRLLKFSCHQCGAKLAVPLQMAGLSDNCPKCGALVTSPTIPAEAAPVQVPATVPAKEGWSAEQLADALRPQTPKAPPVGVEKGPATAPTKVSSANPASRAPQPAAPAPAPAALVAAPAPSAPVELPAPEILASPKPEAAPSPSPFQGGPERAELSTGPNPEFPSASATAALAAAAAELAPERGRSMSTEAAHALGEAPKVKSDPDLFGSAFPFPQAPQLNGLVPEESNSAPAAQESPGAHAPKTSPAKGQEGRMRSKLQSISRLNPDPALSAGPEGERDRGPEPGPKTKSKIAPATPPAAPAPEPESTVAPGASALVPDTLPDEETAEEAAQPGMGEVLTSGGAGGGSMLLPPHDARPWLYVPLVTVGSSPRRERRMRLNRIAMIGVVSFLMVDLLVVLWFCRKPIAAWFAGPPQSHGPAIPQAVQNERSGREEIADSSAAVPQPRPEESPPTLAPTTQDPPPVAPEASKTGEDAPVPMAIPVTDFPGEPSQAATPVTPAVPAAAPLVAATPPPVAMPAPAPAVVLDQPPGATPPPTLSEPVVASSTSGSSAPVPGAEAPTTMALANSPATSPPPPADLPPGLGAPAGLATAPGEVPYGGLPPPPADMALPNEPAPAEMSGPAVTLVTTPASSVKVSKLPREAQTALEVLQKFLDAPTWRDRMPYVQKADALKSALDKQPGQFSEGPIRVGQIDFVDRYVNKNGVPPYCMFELTGGSLEHPVLTLVEQSTKGGVRVDWEAFVDFKDSLLLKFLENQGAPNSKFRVMLRRKHYFDKDVPEVSLKDAFEVKQPHGPFQGHIFVPKKSSLAQQLANQLGWGMDMPVIAELAWRTDGKHHWVEMVSISSYGWRG